MARDPRPIGCRVYFCDPDYQTRQSEIIETAIAELKQIADEFGTGWHYAPLHHFLNDPQLAVTTSTNEPVVHVAVE